MSSARTVAWCILVWIAGSSVVRADSWTSGTWATFFDTGSSVPNAAAQTATPAPLVADAFLNFGSAGYSEASLLTVGTPTPWYQSPAVAHAFGHTPTATEQSAFTSEVLADVNTTFSLAGLNPVVTLDPTVTAHHTLSVVSGLSYAANANAIGITDVGHDGFGLIDKLSYATSPDQLAWAVAHNVSHELMHAFGVGIHADQTGTYIDGATATWSLLTDPNATFSPAAVKLISATNFGPSVTSSTPGNPTGLLKLDGDQEILAVPEPSALAAWSVVVLGLFYHGRRAGRRETIRSNFRIGSMIDDQ